MTEVVVTGFATEICVESTARQALSRGYDVVLVADGHTTSGRPAASGRSAAPEASVAHHNEIYRNLRFPGRRVRVLPAAEVDFGRGTPRAPRAPLPRADSYCSRSRSTMSFAAGFFATTGTSKSDRFIVIGSSPPRDVMRRMYGAPSAATSTV